MKKIILITTLMLLSFAMIGMVSAATINVPVDQPTIQAAINAAQSNDIINIAPGTYAETLTFGSTFVADNLVIQAADPNNKPVITKGVYFWKFTDPINGITFKNLYLSGAYSATYKYVIKTGWEDFSWRHAAINNFVMDNCVIDGSNYVNSGMKVDNFTGDITFTNNEFKNTNWAVVDFNGPSDGSKDVPVDNFVWANNYVHDCDGTVALRGYTTDKTDVVTVSGNRWENIGGYLGSKDYHWSAIEVNNAKQLNMYDNVINNVVVDAWGEGEAIQFWNVDSVNIYNNDFTNNYQGIYVYGSLIPSGSIHNNNIVNNDQYGLLVESTIGAPLNAVNNWWGSDQLSAITPLISGLANYIPFLCAPAPTGKPSDAQGSCIPKLVYILEHAGKSCANAEYATIQAGIDAASAGQTVVVCPGTYNEALAVSKSLTIQGAGKASTIVNSGASSGISLVGSEPLLSLTVKDLTLQATSPSGHGISPNWATGAPTVLDGLTIEDVVITGYNCGVRKASYTPVQNVNILDSNIDGNLYGICTYNTNAVASPLNTFDNVLIQDSTFNNNKYKGMYFESLSNAVIDGVTIDGSGYSGGHAAGIDINLKFRQTYQDIKIMNSAITNSGNGDLVNGACLMIKARNDGGTYGANPAALTGVELTGNTISGCPTGIRFGEVNTVVDEVLTNVAVSNNVIAGNSLAGLRNIAFPVALTKINAVNNYWGDAKGPFVAGELECTSGDKIIGPASWCPFYKDIGLTDSDTICSCTPVNGDKLNALATLQRLPGNTVNPLKDAIKELTESLNITYWINPMHVICNGGDKYVFDNEKNAVYHLMKITPIDSRYATVRQVILNIVAVDRMLANTLYMEAKAANPTCDPLCGTSGHARCTTTCNELKTSAKYLTEGDKKAAEGKYKDAVDKYKSSWQHSKKVAPICNSQAGTTSCSSLKPIQYMVLEYAGTKPVSNVAYYSASSTGTPSASYLMGNTGPLSTGSAFSFGDYAARNAPNDVDFLITFEDGTMQKSRFHLSCSDSEMNGAADCGALEGNAKDNSVIGGNLWYLRDLQGNGLSLCTTQTSGVTGNAVSGNSGEGLLCRWFGWFC